MHSSPVKAERRKTMTAKPYVSLDDHYRALFEQDTRPLGHIRPLSWHHPSSDAPSRTAHRSPFNASLTPAVAPRSLTPARMQDQSRHQRNISFADHATFSQGPPMYNIASGSFPASFAPPPRSINGNGVAIQPPQVSMSYEPLPLHHIPQAAPTSMPFDPQDYLYNPSNFLPIQNPAELVEPALTTLETPQDVDDTGEELGEELVGLGLYDAPQTAPNPRVTRLMQVSGRGLKLEESWKPPEEKKDDDREEEDASSPEDIVGQAPIWDGSQQTNLAGTSFFFDDEDGRKADWYQHSTSVFDAELTHGVLQRYLLGL